MEKHSMKEVHSDDDLVEHIRFGDENAEDLTQETFLKLFRKLLRYKGKRKFKAYLYTIANHLCIDESRKM